jgi:esterase
MLHFKTIGQGRPLILLHGLFGASDNWLGIAPRLAEHFQLFLPDLRNHGQSPHHGEMTYLHLAEDVAHFMAARELDSARVVGHSMGGKVAMQLALKYPVRVEKLVVADMAPRAYEPLHDKIFATLLALDLPSFTTRQQVEVALCPEIPNLVLRRFLLKNLGRDVQGKFYWKMNLRGVAENYRQLGEPLVTSAPFAGPTLFIRGGQSRYVLPSDAPLIRELFPVAQIQTIESASHWIQADAPDEFVRRVLAFL